MRKFLALSILLTGCVSQQPQPKEPSYYARQQQKWLATIDAAGVPDSHFDHSVNRNPDEMDRANEELAYFSGLYLEAKQGRLKSVARVGTFYYKGIAPVERNYQEAVKWLTIGADRDDADCQVYLGECYFLGLGVPVNNDRAKELINRAKSQGVKSLRVNFIESKGSYNERQVGATYEPTEAMREVTFESAPDGKASWQHWMKEFEGRTVRTQSQDILRQVVTAKSEMILRLNRMDLHNLYGKGTDREKYEQFLVLLKQAREAQAELRRLINLYGS